MNKVKFLKEAQINFHPTLLFILSDDFELIKKVKELNLRSIILTSNEEIKVIETKKFKVCLTSSIEFGLDKISKLRDAIVQFYMEGFVNEEDKLLGFGEEGTTITLVFVDMKSEERLKILKKACGGDLDIKVVEEGIKIAKEIAHEKGAGGLLVIGDTEAVLRKSSQLILNPFKGYPKRKRSILNESIREAIKEFAKLDGALILRKDGGVEAAGRYINIKKPKRLPPGLGGRHLAATTITSESKALAITCSATGIIRIFKNGKVVLTLGE
jgi:DNA integrity scanning protein DisA with diadenylate cyclase activity